MESNISRSQASLRRAKRLQIAVFVFALFIAGASGFARDANEQKRIDYLIDSLAELKGAVFIRNGSEYDAQKAQSHLRQKLNYAGERVKTAEQFIQYCASESSMSHRPYQIRKADGTTVNTADYFKAKLRDYDGRVPR